MAFLQEFMYNKSFSQLAKESNFSFNLYRGRVDWRKLETLDVDRIVRDQDVELLNIHISSVTNCNLESEYDVKILDPTFIKLFRLAQLLIDFLMHCKQYLEHCIKVAHESLQASNKEVEILRKQLQARKSEVKHLKKKMKEVKQQLLHTPRISGPIHECSFCGKVFMNENYLHGHHTRRHNFLPFPLALKPHSTQASPQAQVIVQEDSKTTQKPEELTSMKKKYQEEIEDMKKVFFAEIEKLKQTGSSQSNSNITKTGGEDDKRKLVKVDLPMQAQADNLKTSEKEVLTVIERCEENEEEQKTSNTPTPQVKHSEIGAESKKKEGTKSRNEQGGEGEEGWQQRMEEREGVWRARLSALDQQHKKQVMQLQDRLNSSQLQGQEMKRDLERRLEEVLTKFEQSQLLLENRPQSSNKDYSKQKNNFIPSSPTKTQKDSPKSIQSVEVLNETTVKPQPPFQKRRAFVSQKTKTIQDEDSFEIPLVKETTNNLVKILQSDDESEFENTQVKIKSLHKKISEYTSQPLEKEPSLPIQFKNTDVPSKSKNKESIITQLLEEEKLKNVRNTKFETVATVIEEDESSVEDSVTYSGSDTESLEEKQETGSKLKRERHQEESSDDQMLRNETKLTQQSLQSMESLLAANPSILQQLRGDLTQLLSRRLQGLGVDPGWGSLPPSTFHNKMAVLTQQRQITAKNHAVYFTLRDKLNEDADAAVHSRPPQSSADSLLARLRKKAAQVVSAAKFTRYLGSNKMQESLSKSQPLASSSPHDYPQSSSIPLSKPEENTTFMVPKVQAIPSKDSLSLSSSTYEEEEEEEEEKLAAVNVTYTKPKQTPEGSYKSALRNAVSTGNLAKKKVLFVDEAIEDRKRSRSEQTIPTLDSFSSPHSHNRSVASLVQEIQNQLGQRSGKPALSVDLMKQPDSAGSVQSTQLPLTQILPLSKSGRELLEAESKLVMAKPSPTQQSQRTILAPAKTPPRTLEPITQLLKKVPLSKPIPTNNLPESLGDLKKSASKNLLQAPKLSPTHSLTSIGSSLLDISVSPRTSNTKDSLEWDLQDLEDNLRD